MKKSPTAFLLKVPPFVAAFFFLMSVSTLVAQRPNSAWGTIPSPNAGFGPNELFDVAVLSGTDIWAVGNFGDFSSPEPQVQHWDGASWRVVATPSGVKGDLIGVSALATNDVWFVGGLHWRNIHLSLGRDERGARDEP